MFRTVETMTEKQVYTDDEFINIGFKNNHHYDESVINAPITYQGNAVGVITDIDDTYVVWYFTYRYFTRNQCRYS